MTASFRKIGPNVWGIQADEIYEPGAIVKVATRSGAVKEVKIATRFTTQQYGKWVYGLAPQERKFESAQVGNLDAINQMFNNARKTGKFPAIVLAVPGTSEIIRINVAGERAKVPGSLNICSDTKDDRYGKRFWYGRVLQSGVFEKKEGTPNEVVSLLTAFAANPAEVARQSGKLTKCCCFCNKKLDNPVSVELGFGPTCAKKFGVAYKVPTTVTIDECPDVIPPLPVAAESSFRAFEVE